LLGDLDKMKTIKESLVTRLEPQEQDLKEANLVLSILDKYIQTKLVQDVDYGKIPYCGNKDILFKSGAEKLCRLFKLRPKFELIDSIVDYEKNLFHYHYRCSLFRDGELVGESDAIANSKEKKFNRKGFDYSVINLVVKMAQKRALVGTVLIVCGVSNYFTQDLEDR
jgi:hypothetical protein